MKRSSLQSKIPEEVREELSNDNWMKRCCLWDSECSGRVEWNHHLKYAGKRQNKIYGILPMCSTHHRKEAQFRHILDEIMVDRIHHFRMVEEFKNSYQRSSLIRSL